MGVLRKEIGLPAAEARKIVRVYKQNNASLIRNKKWHEQWSFGVIQIISMITALIVLHNWNR